VVSRYAAVENYLFDSPSVTRYKESSPVQWRPIPEFEATSFMNRLFPFVFVLFCCTGASAINAQDLPDVAQGLTPYTAFHGGDLDSVSMTNGGLTIKIPLVSYPQLGSLSLSYSVVFNSFAFQDLAICDAAAKANGPQLTIPYRAGCTNTIQQTPTGIFGTFPIGPRVIADQTLFAGGSSGPWQEDVPSSEWPIWGRFYVNAADGSQHPLAPTSNGYQSTDDSGYMFVPSQTPGYANLNIGTYRNAFPGDTGVMMTGAAGTITDPHGTKYTAGAITDPDGNTIQIGSSWGSTFLGVPATDSVQRSIPAPTTGNVSSCPVLSSAQNQSVSSALLWTVPGQSASNTVSYLFCYANVNIYTHLLPGTSQTASNQEYIRTVSMLQSITLPNGTFWGFIYDSVNPSASQATTLANSNSGYGELLTLMYPTGGSVSYTYQMAPGNCNSQRPNGTNSAGATILAFAPLVASRTMTSASGTVLGQWTYPVPGEVIAPDGSLTVTSAVAAPAGVAPCSLFDGGETVYAGSSATGTPLRTTVKSYTFAGDVGIPTAVAPRLVQTVTTLANGLSTTVNQSYGPTISFSVLACDDTGNNCGTGGEPFQNPVGGPTSTTTIGYDGTTLKTNNTTFQWQENSSYLAANLIDIPYATSVLDGTGNQRSLTTYNYDESAYSPGGIRGHATTTTKWLNTSSTQPTIHTGWLANGMKSYVIDADANAGIAGHVNSSPGHTIDYGYNSSSCGGSKVTSTTDALGEVISGTYYCATGLLNTYTDANLNRTTVSWDVMNRLASIISPSISAGTPTTSFNYSDSTNTVTRTIIASPDPAQTLEVVFDGFGREIHRYTTDSPGPDTVDTTYDSDGRVVSVSNPYASADSDGTSGITTYTYDPLNRKTVETEPDGSMQVWCYDGVSSSSGQSTACSGNQSSTARASWVDYLDQANSHWQHVSDGLGRLVAAMEPLPTTNAPTLQTDYTYDPLNNLLSVDQIGGSSETPHVRSFTYDSLSRLLCAANPENSENTCPSSGLTSLPSGIVSYGYDPNGNVTSKTDARGIAISYGYDGLNRILSKSYSDGFTLPVAYTYGLPGTQTSNAVGRLISEKVVNGSTVVSQRSPTAYDAMGHVSQLTECTPANCSATPYQFAYNYDTAGNEISSTNGIPSSTFNGVTGLPSVTLSMGYDQVGRLSAVTSSWSDSLAHPATLFQANSYTSAGGLKTATYGINADSGQTTATLSRTYDDRLRVTSETDSATALLTRPATPATGAVTFSGTEQAAYLAPTKATGTITVTGTEGSHQVCTTRTVNGMIVQTCTPFPDSGFLTVIIDGFTAQGSYGSGSTDPTVAASLAAALNGSGSPVTATSSSNIVTITSVAAGTAANYTYTVTNGTDFSGTDAGVLAGGSAGPPTSDAGTITVTVGGTSVPVAWGSGSTTATLASALYSALQASASGLVKTSLTSTGVALSSVQTGTAGNVTISCTVTHSTPQFATVSFSPSCSGLSGAVNAGTSTAPAYSYSIASSSGATGYAANGNVLNAADSVAGTWSYGYDYLNRLTSATGSAGTFNGTIGVSGVSIDWQYDSFGNRTLQSSSTVNLPSEWAQYTPASNRLVSTNLAIGSMQYDAAGDVTFDGINSYAYDAEGRVCAVGNGSAYTGYVYDAEGNRAAKGSINGLNCNLSANGFSLTKSYIRGTGGELLTEMGAGGQWVYSDAYADGQLRATYNVDGNTYFALNDWLGTKRAELSAAGCLETFGSLPFGDDLTPLGNCPDANEQHFTGKERDNESGLDYFGARYYGSSMGRMMSPDPGNIGANPANPQSWNMYSYSLNNPLTMTDPTGLYVCADGSKCDSANDKAFAASLSTARDAANQLTGDDKTAALRAVNSYGAQGVDNGVKVGFDSKVDGGLTQVSGIANGNKSADNPTGQNINVTFNPNGAGDASLVGHEGSHVADGSDWVASGFSASKDPTNHQTEMDANHVQFNIANVMSAMKYDVAHGGSYTNSLYGGSVSWKNGATFKMITPDLSRVISQQEGAKDNQPAFTKGSVLKP
jgi:RHS repeat-associated protein